MNNMNQFHSYRGPLYPSHWGGVITIVLPIHKPNCGYTYCNKGLQRPHSIVAGACYLLCGTAWPVRTIHRG